MNYYIMTQVSEILKLLCVCACVCVRARARVCVVHLGSDIQIKNSFERTLSHIYFTIG